MNGLRVRSVTVSVEENTFPLELTLLEYHLNIKWLVFAHKRPTSAYLIKIFKLIDTIGIFIKQAPFKYFYYINGYRQNTVQVTHNDIKDGTGEDV